MSTDVSNPSRPGTFLKASMNDHRDQASVPAGVGQVRPGAAVRHTAVREHLAQWKGAKVYRAPLVDERGLSVGNNGDHLMVMGTDVVFRDLGLGTCDRPEDANLIVFPSSGGMLEKMQRVPAIFKELCARFPATPLCVLPSSYYWPTRSFREQIGDRRAPTMLFCREPISFQHLTRDHDLQRDGIEVRLDHDMAFELETEPVVTARRDLSAGRVLIVERTDVEHVSIAMNSSRLGARKSLSKRTPAWLKRALYPLLNKARSTRQTPFRVRCEALLREHCPASVDAPRDVADVSNINTCSFEGFCDRVAASEVVFTTRLHAGLYAAMLGRRTFIFEGSYHKIRGIYEQTLKDRPNVTYVPNQ